MIPLKCANFTHLNNISKCCKVMTKHNFFYITFLKFFSEILFNLCQKNVTVIFASKSTNFTDFYGKLF